MSAKRKKKKNTVIFYTVLITVIIVVYACLLGLSLNMMGSGKTAPSDTDYGESTRPMTPETDRRPGRPGVVGTDETKAPVESETSAPSVPPHVDTRIDYLAESGGRLELPVDGASGYASIPLNVTAGREDDSETVGKLTSGQCFRILHEDGEKWEIQTDEFTGWVAHRYCFINLPDVIPSIIYNDTNARASIFISSGKDIPGITHEKLYNAYSYNERLDRDEYIMPVLYSMAPKICAAQQAALADGHTLVIYETFRPREVQEKVVSLLTLLSSVDAEVKAGIATAPWSMTWFISTGISNHQKGYAFDVSLGKVNEKTVETIGDYKVTRVTDYSEYAMQTPMHELSMASISMTEPVSSKSDTAWRDVPLAPGMNATAKLLREICTGVGLSPLASEWWHFNDLDTAKLVADSSNKGEYYIDTQMSAVPPEL